MGTKVKINQKRIWEEFRQLVSIDSVSFKERQMADALTAKMNELGFQAEEDDIGARIGGNAGNIYGFLKGTIPGEPILLSAHMDTVTPGVGKQAVLHEDGKITSAKDTVLGADDVNGIVGILEGIRSVREAGIAHRDIEVVFPVAEEVYSKGSEIMSKGCLYPGCERSTRKRGYTGPHNFILYCNGAWESSACGLLSAKGYSCDQNYERGSK